MGYTLPQNPPTPLQNRKNVRCQIQLTYGRRHLQSDARLWGESTAVASVPAWSASSQSLVGETSDLGRAGCCHSITLCMCCSLHSVPGEAPGAQGPTCAGHAGARMTITLCTLHWTTTARGVL